MFLNLVNFQGFILEEVVCEAVSNINRKVEIHQGEVFDSSQRRGGGRVEIDLWIKIGNFVFDFESKRSDFDWVFLRNSEDKNNVHIISGPNKNAGVMNHVFKKIDCVTKQVIEVSENAKTFELFKGKNDKNQPASVLPLRSKREDYVHNAIRQALFNTEVLIHDHAKDDSWSGAPHRIFIPVIVTNARLLSASYSITDINNKARLTKFENIKQVPFAAINHAEILFQGPHFESQILHMGGQKNQLLDIPDDRFKGTHNKTVFIVNKSYTSNFIDVIVNKLSLNKDC